MAKNLSKFVLIQDLHQYLLDLHIYIPDFLTLLWEQPVIFSTLLCNSNIKDIKNNLAPFICNNFYENILSPYNIGGHLICLITLILKEEIKNLKSYDNTENFLNESPCFYIFKELVKKGEVQSLFENIMIDIVEKMEVSYSSKKLNFNAEKIVKDIDVINEKIQKTNPGKKIKDIEKEIFRKNFDVSLNDPSIDDKEKGKENIRENELAIFNSKYIPNLTKDELEKIISKSNDLNLKGYCQNKIKIINDNKKELFTNEKFLDKILKSPLSTIVLAFYQHDFCLLIDLIDESLKSIYNNIQLISYPLKCFCKIILLLIRNKFKNSKITKTQEYSFVAKFFFSTLFLNILRNPAIAGLISNFIISGITMNNLKILCDVLNQLVLGNFFINDEKQCDFTPFNWYFIEKMPFVIKIFDDLTNVELPKYVLKIINDKIPNDFYYDYFSDQPEEVIFHRSICFKLDDISTLYNNMLNCQNLLFKDCQSNKKLSALKITFNKLNSKYYLKLMEDLKKNQEFLDIEKERNNYTESHDLINYYLINEIIINPKYKKLYELEQKKPNFYIKELKTIENDEQLSKNYTIKVKNFFSGLLYNYRKLIKTDFDIGVSDNNTIAILKKLKFYLKSFDYTIDGNIPSEWYVNSLLEYLKKIPQKLTDNDNEKLFDELENDVSNSIRQLNFNIMGECLDKIKFIKKKMNYFVQAKILIVDIELNQKVKEIVENEIIPIEMSYKYNASKKKFEIKKCGKYDRKNSIELNIHDTKNGNKVCLTIDSFTKIFPNIIKTSDLEDVSPFVIESDLKIPQKIDAYFKIVEDYLISKKIVTANTDECKKIKEKIYDFIMNKIYEKLFPQEQCLEDIQIYQKCFLLSWTEPKNFIPGKTNYVYDSFLPDVLNYFHQIDKEKSPRKKIMNMMKAVESIGYILELNGGSGNYGIDDIIPILNYAVIKSTPLRMYSNIKYMELFIGNKKQSDEGHKLSAFSGLCKYVQDLSYKNLGVSQEEYEKNCIKVADARAT